MPNPTQIKRISEVAKELANGKERGEILAKYGKKWQIAPRSVDRLLEKAKPHAEKLRDLANKTANDTIISETQNAVKLGLKSKIERTLNLQKQLDDLQIRLDRNAEEDIVVVQGKIQKVKRPLTVSETTNLVKTIKELTALIGVNEGDAATTKTEINGTLAMQPIIKIKM